MITLTSKQEQGIRIAKERYRAGEKFTCIAGYETLDKFLNLSLDKSNSITQR